MSITVEEMNLISIYHEDTRAGQLARLRAVRPLYLGDPELLSVVDSAEGGGYDRRRLSGDRL